MFFGFKCHVIYIYIFFFPLVTIQYIASFSCITFDVKQTIQHNHLSSLINVNLNSPLSSPFPNNHSILISLAMYFSNIFPPLCSYHALIIFHVITAKVLMASRLVHFKTILYTPPEFFLSSKICHLTLPLIMVPNYLQIHIVDLNLLCSVFLIWPCLLLTSLLVSLCTEK